jgi:hypothetical protein
VSRTKRGCVQSPGGLFLTRRIAARWKAPWELSWALRTLAVFTLGQGPNEGAADTAETIGKPAGKIIGQSKHRPVLVLGRALMRGPQMSCKMGHGEMTTNMLEASDWHACPCSCSVKRGPNGRWGCECHDKWNHFMGSADWGPFSLLVRTTNQGPARVLKKRERG